MSFPFCPCLDDDRGPAADAHLNPASRVGAAFGTIQVFESNDDALDASVHPAERRGEPRCNESLKPGAQRVRAVHGDVLFQALFGSLVEELL